MWTAQPNMGACKEHKQIDKWTFSKGIITLEMRGSIYKTGKYEKAAQKLWKCTYSILLLHNCLKKQNQTPPVKWVTRAFPHSFLASFSSLFWLMTHSFVNTLVTKLLWFPSHCSHHLCVTVHSAIREFSVCFGNSVVLFGRLESSGGSIMYCRITLVVM